MTSAGSGKDLGLVLKFTKHVQRQHWAFLWVSAWSLYTSLVRPPSLAITALIYLGHLEAPSGRTAMAQRVLGLLGVGVALITEGLGALPGSLMWTRYGDHGGSFMRRGSLALLWICHYQVQFRVMSSTEPTHTLNTFLLVKCSVILRWQ